ncbi:Gluconate transport-inducing protein, partial [Massospora cicadina]
METYYGHVSTVGDALKLIEAVRFGVLPLIQRRLNANERSCIRSGSVFVFDSSKSGVQRWTDGFRWSASRLHGHFLIYHQKEGEYCRYSGGQLIKRALSVVTADNRRFGLISYYTQCDVECGLLKPPSFDPTLSNIEISNDYCFRRVPQLTTHPIPSHSPPSSRPNNQIKFPPMALNRNPIPRPSTSEDQRQLNAINAFFNPTLV